MRATRVDTMLLTDRASSLIPPANRALISNNHHSKQSITAAEYNNTNKRRVSWGEGKQRKIVRHTSWNAQRQVNLELAKCRLCKSRPRVGMMWLAHTNPRQQAKTHHPL